MDVEFYNGTSIDISNRPVNHTITIFGGWGATEAGLLMPASEQSDTGTLYRRVLALKNSRKDRVYEKAWKGQIRSGSHVSSVDEFLRRRFDPTGN